MQSIKDALRNGLLAGHFVHSTLVHLHSFDFAMTLAMRPQEVFFLHLVLASVSPVALISGILIMCAFLLGRSSARTEDLTKSAVLPFPAKPTPPKPRAPRPKRKLAKCRRCQDKLKTAKRPSSRSDKKKK
jgi:hypothetical protein